MNVSPNFATIFYGMRLFTLEAECLLLWNAIREDANAIREDVKS